MKNAVVATESAMIYPSVSGIRRASWGAIFAGTFLALVLQLTLTFLGTAIGIGTLNLQEQNPFQGLGWGAAVWLFITIVISTWCGAFVAGRFSGGPRRADGLLHGLVTWSFTIIIVVTLLVSAVGRVLGGAGKVIGDVVTNLGTTPAGQNVINNAAANSQAQPAAPALSPTGREPGAATTAQPTENAQQKARDVGQAAATGISTTAWAGFGALLLGLLVSAWGGWAGTASLSGYTEAAINTPAPA